MFEENDACYLHWESSGNISGGANRVGYVEVYYGDTTDILDYVSPDITEDKSEDDISLATVRAIKDYVTEKTPTVTPITLVEGEGISIDEATTDNGKTYTISCTVVPESSNPLTFDEEWFTITDNHVTFKTTKLNTLIEEAATEAATEAVNDLRIDIHVTGLVDEAVQGYIRTTTSTLSESGGESIAPLNLGKDTNIIDTVVK